MNASFAIKPSKCRTDCTQVDFVDAKVSGTLFNNVKRVMNAEMHGNKTQVRPILVVVES